MLQYQQQLLRKRILLLVTLLVVLQVLSTQAGFVPNMVRRLFGGQSQHTYSEVTSHTVRRNPSSGNGVSQGSRGPLTRLKVMKASSPEVVQMPRIRKARLQQIQRLRHKNRAKRMYQEQHVRGALQPGQPKRFGELATTKRKLRSSPRVMRKGPKPIQKPISRKQEVAFVKSNRSKKRHR